MDYTWTQIIMYVFEIAATPVAILIVGREIVRALYKD